MRNRSFFKGLVLSAALVVHAIHARADLPLVSGNYQIAYKFLHGDAHVVVLGDSEQNVLMGLYPSYWKVDNWSGQANLQRANGGNSGASLNIVDQPFLESSGIYRPFDPTPPDGQVAVSPATIPRFVFNGSAAGPVGDAAGHLLYNRLTDQGLVTGQDSIYYGGKWADKSTGTLTYSLLTYANPNGVAPGNLELNVRINDPNNAVATVPISTLAVTSQYQTTSVSFAAQAWNNPDGLVGSVSVIAGQAPAAGSNLIVAGARITTGQPGFQLADLHYGGVGVDYYLDPKYATDTAVKAYLDFTDSNIAYIWLGQNNIGGYTGAQYQAKIEQILARYRAARPGMQFVLVSTYDTGDPSLADFAQALYNLSQSDSDTVFLNLYKSAGDFQFLNANYLLDRVHENDAGNYYMAAQTESLLELAAAQVPEPASLSLVGLTAFALLRRRAGRRR